MSRLFQQLLVEPLVAVLRFLYQTVAFQDLGVAIVFLTIIVRLVLFPLFYKGLKSQALLQKLRPEIVKIQDRHKNNREQQAVAMMALYKQNKINPFTSFLLILVQLPILIALYRVFLNLPSELGGSSLGLLDLRETSIIVVALAALSQYLLGRISLPKRLNSNDSQMQVAKNMVFLGPILTVAVLAYLPAAVGVYWLATTLFSLGQQWYVNKVIYHGTDSTNNPKSSGAGRLQ